MIFIWNYSGTDVIDFGEYESIEHLDYIVVKLREKFDVKIISKVDGPGATIWQLKIDDFYFKLINHCYGNYLRPDEQTGKQFLHQIFPLVKILFY